MSLVAGEEPQPAGEEDAALELLRQFDLAWQYGPCTGERHPTSRWREDRETPRTVSGLGDSSACPAGITRLQRWHRAEQMGLQPPPEVRRLLKAHPGDPRFQYRSETDRRVLGPAGRANRDGGGGRRTQGPEQGVGSSRVGKGPLRAFGNSGVSPFSTASGICTRSEASPSPAASQLRAWHQEPGPLLSSTAEGDSAAGPGLSGSVPQPPPTLTGPSGPHRAS